MNKRSRLFAPCTVPLAACLSGPDSTCRLRRLGPALAAAVAVLLLAGASHAGTVIVSTSDNQLQPGVDNQGWLSDLLRNGNPTNDNYITGNNDVYRSYFFFDLSGITQPVLSAKLELRRYLSGTGVTILFSDVSTPVSQLIATRGGPIDVLAYDDLGTGISYGSFTIGSGSTLDVLSFELNSSAVADINAATGYFAIGGRVTSAGAMFAASGEEPGNSDTNFTQQLVLEVEKAPGVPSVSRASLLALAGLLGAFGHHRRRSHIGHPQLANRARRHPPAPRLRAPPQRT